MDMQDSSQIADMAERFFFGLNAKVEFVPVMSAVSYLPQPMGVLLGVSNAP